MRAVIPLLCIVLAVVGGTHGILQRDCTRVQCFVDPCRFSPCPPYAQCRSCNCVPYYVNWFGRRVNCNRHY